MENFMKSNFVIKEITFANIIKAGKGANMHKNRLDYGLAIFLGGERTFYFDNAKLNVKGNSIVYFPKGSNYIIKNKEFSDCYAINFQLHDNVDIKPFSFKVKNLSVYLECFKTAQRFQSRKSVGYDAKIKSELYNIIYNMQKEYRLPYSKLTGIEPALNYIHKHYLKENISVEYLASICGISTVYLRSLFVKNFALSPIKYINNLKLARAKELLNSQFFSISEVCFLSGYKDESYFSREFKKAFSVTPSEYKKTN